jgi:hypothetical protein
MNCEDEKCDEGKYKNLIKKLLHAYSGKSGGK